MAPDQERQEQPSPDLSALISPLLEWYWANRRDLPWRETRHPYHVWLSEIMLQQTRVETALPYFDRFIKRYPRLEDLAHADEEEVLSLWSGLGYYNRARNLRKAASIVCKRFDGRFPCNYEDALELPGVGRYTAGAILSIAYDQPVPILDGNIRRLLARLLALEIPPPRLDRKLWKALGELVKKPVVRRQISDFNQALMELGALICLPRNPHCQRCPLAAHCSARARRIQEELPRKQPSRPAEKFVFTLAVIRQENVWLLHQTSNESFLRGFWEFPRIQGTPDSAGVGEFRRCYDLELRLGESFAPVRHQITFRKLVLHPVAAELRAPVSGDQWRWSTLEDDEVPVASYTRKVLSRVQKKSGQQTFRYNLPHDAG